MFPLNIEASVILFVLAPLVFLNVFKKVPNTDIGVITFTTPLGSFVFKLLSKVSTKTVKPVVGFVTLALVFGVIFKFPVNFVIPVTDKLFKVARPFVFNIPRVLVFVTDKLFNVARPLELNVVPNIAPLIPTPPVTKSAPVIVLVDAVAAVIDVIPEKVGFVTVEITLLVMEIFVPCV